MKPPAPLVPVTFFERALGYVSPSAQGRHMAARYKVHALHQFGYDGARATTRRQQAPQNINPNDYQKQRDRLQLMREAEDLENNFGPAKMLNRKYAMYVAPQSYHAQTGDTALDTDVEAWLNESWFPFCDITGQYDFFAMMNFGVIGMNRGGDYGWAYMRPGLEEGMSDEDALQLPFCIQAVEPDRIGGIYQNVVSDNYVSGVVIGGHGQPTHYRVFQRSTVSTQYTNPIDVPVSQFVHYTDPMRHDTYRGVSKHETGVTAMRDMYELFEFIKGKAKLAAALTVFTNSQGAVVGQGAMDGYETTIAMPNGGGAMQQDILHGQINHLPQGTNIEFPDSATPGEQVQYAIKQLLKFTAMGFNLPYSFALDATDLGGVSGRLESEQARAEFERGQKVIAPKATRIKNAALLDAMGKGIFPASVRDKIFKGRWGYRPHPQPDIGKEATANVALYQNGLLDPMEYWTGTMGTDPETVAMNASHWVSIKKKAAVAFGNTVEEVFGNGPIAPGTQDKDADKNAPTTTATTTNFHRFGIEEEPRDSSGKWTSGGAPSHEGVPEGHSRVEHAGIQAETEKAIRVKVPTDDGGMTHIWIPKSQISETDRVKNHVVIPGWLKRAKEQEHADTNGAYRWKEQDPSNLNWKSSTDEAERAARLKAIADAEARAEEDYKKKHKGKSRPPPKKAAWE